MVLDFDLSEIPNEATITNAILKLYANKSYQYGVNGKKSLYQLNSQWNENSITWNNCPRYSNTPIVKNDNTSFNVYEEYDVTEYLKDSNGFILIFDNYEPLHGVSYISSEGDAEFIPKLIVNYDITNNINKNIIPAKHKIKNTVMYNLQGKKITSLNNGLYIKVVNGKSYKIFNKKLLTIK